MSPPRILAFAYACEPGQGSEAGAGWTHARMLAGLGETWVLTRAVPPDADTAGWPADLAAGSGYDQWLAGLPEEGRLRLVHVPIPWWDRFWWERRPWRPRFTRLQRIEYLLWQWLALRTARRLMRDRRFDAAWHLTWANVWMGSTLSLTGLPFVYGPVGGGIGPPWRLVAGLGARAFASEVARELLKASFRYLNPLVRLAWQRAALILVQNPETRDWLPVPHRKRAVVLPNAVPTDVQRRKSRTARPPYTAMFAGRLVAWKGSSLAIRAIAQLPEWRLLVVGDGTEGPRLRRLVCDLGLDARVEFLGHVPRAQVLEIMRERADLFLFPSLHDDAGLVVAEAIAAGLPVVCLDRGGPPVLGGIGVAPTSRGQTVRALAEAVRSAPIGEAPPVAPTLESRRAELARLVRRFGVFEPEDTAD